MTATTTRAAETWAHILAQPDGYPMGVAADWLQEHADHEGSPEAKAEACAAVEAVAQAHLDAHPDDHRARWLLGEWLQWHGDARGEGYVALGACERVPHPFIATHWHWSWRDGATYAVGNWLLPRDWFRFLHGAKFDGGEGMDWPFSARDAMPRRAAEDAASLAFLRLPEPRRKELLAGHM